MNINMLRKQVNDLLAKLEEDQRRKDESAIVFYDTATGRPLPGYEPSPLAIYVFRLPHNNRDERQR